MTSSFYILGLNVTREGDYLAISWKRENITQNCFQKRGNDLLARRCMNHRPESNRTGSSTGKSLQSTSLCRREEPGPENEEAGRGRGRDRSFSGSRYRPRPLDFGPTAGTCIRSHLIIQY